MVFATHCSAAFLAKYACIKRTLNAIYCLPLHTRAAGRRKKNKKKKDKKEEEEEVFLLKEENQKKIYDGFQKYVLVFLGSGGVTSRASSIFAFFVCQQCKWGTT